MKNYELTYLIPADLSEEEAKLFQNKIASFIQEEGGSLIGEGLILKRRLAYPIKRQAQAYLLVLTFQLEPEKLANLERKLKSENQILRYLLLIKVKPRKIRFVSRRTAPKAIAEEPIVKPEEKKVELKEIEKKLEEILKDGEE